MVANVRTAADGNLEPVQPPQFDAEATAVLLDGVAGAGTASPIAFVPWTEFLVDGSGYQLRTVYGVGEEYPRVMGLELVAGSAFSAAEVAAGAREALISATLAEILFGSAAAALGGTIEAPANIAVQTDDAGLAEVLAQIRRLLSPVFTVRGVYAAPGEVDRRAYGIADLVVPAGAMFPGNEVAFVDRAVMSRIALRVAGNRFATVESQVRAALAKQYGPEVAVAVWEGPPTGGSAALEKARTTVATFSLVANLLVLLVTACVGILGVMLVEVLGRSRAIAVARAVGASRVAVAREFWRAPC